MFDYTAMQRICLAPIKYFWKLGGDVVDTKDGKFTFFDNHSKILAVAHLDTVEQSKHFHRNRIGGHDWLLCPQIDNRLGTYVILELLRKMGMKYDILLTEGEEQGKSTAAYFTKTKQYHWMFSFDRAGEDVVYYQYHSLEWVNAIKDAGFLDTARGSRSDIDYLEELECRGMNIGTGLEQSTGHSIWARANMSVLTMQVGRFIKFYNKNKDVLWPYRKWSSNTKYNNYGYGKYAANNMIECAACDRLISRAFAKTNGGLCIMCSEKNTDYCVKCRAPIEYDSAFAELCRTCEKTWSVCAVSACQDIVLASTTEHCMCKKCVEHVESGGSKITDYVCPGCRARMMSGELYKYQKCAMCKNKELKNAP